MQVSINSNFLQIFFHKALLVTVVRGGVTGGAAKSAVSSALVMEEDDDAAADTNKGWGDDEDGFGSDGEVELEGEKAAGDGSDGGT